MYKKVVLPIVLLIFTLQTNNLLFANENAETKTEAGTEAVTESEVTVEISTEPVAEAETEESTKVVAEAEAKPEVSKEAAVGAEAGASSEAVAESEVTPEVSTEPVAEKDVVAIVNGEKIFRKALDVRLQTLKSMNQEISHSVEILVVDQLTKKLLLKQFVNNQNIEVSDEEIKGEIEKIEFLLKSNPGTSEKSLEEILESRGSGIEVLREDIKETLALSKYLRKDISDDVKEGFFNANKIYFNGEKVRVSHVLVDTRNLETEDELKKAKQEIENIKKEIDSGVDIAELAKKHSDCPSADKGGDIGFFERRGSVVEPFARVAFSLKVGEVSDLVETSYGYHIIKVTDRQKGKEVEYEDVKEVVEYVYMEIKTEELVNSLVEKSDIEVLL
jgi:parvulin-like peptidyl-prolyl isomerase